MPVKPGSSIPIIGMSPGNSYFKDEEVKYLLETVITRFGEAAILVADTPAIATYLAFGYPANKARNKAIPKGKNLKNRAARIAEECGLADAVTIIDWDTDVATSAEYQAIYATVSRLYENSEAFCEAVNATTRSVLQNADRHFENLDESTRIASHYLLSELAFLEFAPQLLCRKQAIYVYHKNWHVFERYISGAFDGVAKPHLDFLLIENPYETFMRLLETNETCDEPDLDALARIKRSGIIRAGYQNYAPAFVANEGSVPTGKFYDILRMLADDVACKVLLTEETGYGVITEGLDANRFELFASTVWPTAERMSSALFSIPVDYSFVYMWAAKDAIPKRNYADLLTGSIPIRIAVKENDISHSIAKEDFPEANLAYVPQLADPIEVLTAVATGLADVSFAEAALVHEFTRRTGMKLVMVDTIRPIRCYPNCFMMKRGEHALKRALDNAIARYLQNEAQMHAEVLMQAPPSLRHA